MDFTGRQTTYGSTVPVSCNQGYGIRGTGHITCQTDGTWGGNGECLIKGRHHMNTQVQTILNGYTQVVF